MRLICPRCGAQYEIEDGLIPVAGREVECSSCGNIWFQAGRMGAAGIPAVPATPAAEPAPDPAPEPAPAPALNRPLPRNVLDILRDEAALFRAGQDTDADPTRPARAAETAATAEAPRATDTAPMAQAGAQARTAVTQANADADADAPDTPARATQPAPVGATVAATGPAATAIAPGAGAASPQPVPGSEAPKAPEQRRKTGARTGFAVGLMLAGLVLAAYLLAPRMGEGPAGDALRNLRDGLDHLRIWLSDATQDARGWLAGLMERG